MNKFFAGLGAVAAFAGTVGPLVTGFSPKYGGIVAAVGVTALTVTKPIVDLTAVWKKALGKQ